LTESEMPSHDHTGSISGGSHEHPMSTGAALTLGAGNSLFANSGNPPVTSAGSTGTSTSHSHTLNINNAGSGNAHNNLQPYIALNWIIKT